VPTPRGGGLGIVAGFLIILAALIYQGLFPLLSGLVILAGTMATAMLGWVDDALRLTATTRLVVQLMIASISVIVLGGFEHLRVGSSVIDLGWAGSVLAAIGLVWLINLYNFMDGIDGLAGAEAVTVSLAVSILGAGMYASQIGFSLATLALAAASAAFVFWNWSPAKVFMGDAGSAALGFAFGALALVSELHQGVPLLVLILLLGLFVVDATLTLIDRLRQGEHITVAHRDHVYQRLVRAGWSHRQVTLGAIVINITLLWPAAWVATSECGLALWVFVAVFTLLGVLWWWALRWCQAAARADKGYLL
jgi:Fuc2NAc and GlcNAc transferase